VQVTEVPGDPSLAFNRSLVHDKFRRFAAPVVGAADAEEVLTRCSNAMASGDFSLLV
jgi:hypothetical protein